MKLLCSYAYSTMPFWLIEEKFCEFEAQTTFQIDTCIQHRLTGNGEWMIHSHKSAWRRAVHHPSIVTKAIISSLESRDFSRPGLHPWSWVCTNTIHCCAWWVVIKRAAPLDSTMTRVIYPSKSYWLDDEFFSEPTRGVCCWPEIAFNPHIARRRLM